MKLKDLMKEVSNIIYTSVDNGHYHFAKIDKNGNGYTTTTKKATAHVHKIRKWKVLKAKGHTHEIKRTAGR